MSRPPINRAWWKECTVYQIYPRSFKDSNGDGIGDLKGIIEKLDYIQSLGVDVVWLNPIYASPNDDNGYDISDYRAIMADFGTMEDFDMLLNGLHKRGIKLLMDLVVNHSSDEHYWFRESKSSRDNPYRDYYHWWPAENGDPPKRWSFFDENENAWRYDEKTDAYYLHYFSVKQPDLNWENQKLRTEVYDMMRFWLDKGVDGFRMDVIAFISKDTSFPDLRIHNPADFIAYYAHGPYLHSYLKEMNQEVLCRYDIMTVGEVVGVQSDEALDFVDEDRNELHMFFHFEGMDLDKNRVNWNSETQKFSLREFKAVYTKWDDVFKTKGWGTVYLGNHDQSRMVSRFGNDSPEFREASAKMLLTFLLTQRATPYIYAGDEIGMTNIRFTKIEEYNDLGTINTYHRLKKEGKSTAEFLEKEAVISRDNGRTPMQWNATLEGGFTSGHPWLAVNPNYASVNVQAAEENRESILHYFRNMMALRKSRMVLIYGDYQLIDEENDQVYAYLRTLEQEKIMIVLNFTKDEVDFSIPASCGMNPQVILNNLSDFTMENRLIDLQPFQALILQLT